MKAIVTQIIQEPKKIIHATLKKIFEPTRAMQLCNCKDKGVIIIQSNRILSLKLIYEPIFLSLQIGRNAIF